LAFPPPTAAPAAAAVTGATLQTHLLVLDLIAQQQIIEAAAALAMALCIV